MAMQLCFLAISLSYILSGSGQNAGSGQGTKALERQFQATTGIKPGEVFQSAGSSIVPAETSDRKLQDGRQQRQELEEVQQELDGWGSKTPKAETNAVTPPTSAAAASTRSAMAAPDLKPEGQVATPEEIDDRNSLNPQSQTARPNASVSDQLGQNSDEQAGLDGADAVDVVDVVSSVIPACSCDCCQVSKLLPVDFIPQPDGGQITSTCSASSASDGQLSENAMQEDQQCPSQCHPSEEDSILRSSKGSLDYSRFCHYNCRPVADTAGTACVQFGRDLLAKASASESGNGHEVNAAPVLGIGSGFGLRNGDRDGNGGSSSAGDSDGNGGNSGGDGSAGNGGDGSGNGGGANAQVVYDMRKLIAERLRSEAGAMVSAAASSAEQTRLNLWNTKLATDELSEIDTRTAKTSTSLEGDVTGVESAKETAEEAERKTKNMLAQSHNFAASMIKQVKQLAEVAIKKAVGPCILTAADNRAEGKNLDKPEGWQKVVAARAANPYMQAVSAAVQRTDEYKRMAEGLHQKAMKAQQQANFLMPHTNTWKGQGDTIGAVIGRKQASNLLATAKSLQAQAQEYWNTANSVHATIPRWQDAAAQAAAYASWGYKANEQYFRKLPA